MELRVLEREVWVSKQAQKGWGAESISNVKRTLQFKNKEGNWENVPTHQEFINVTKDGVSEGIAF